MRLSIRDQEDLRNQIPNSADPQLLKEAGDLEFLEMVFWALAANLHSSFKFFAGAFEQGKRVWINVAVFLLQPSEQAR